MKFIAILNFLL